MNTPGADAVDLAEQTDRRLRLAGIQPDDPGLAHIRQWNAAAHGRKLCPWCSVGHSADCPYTR